MDDGDRQPGQQDDPARDDQEMPPDPVSAMAAGSAQLHEIFCSHVEHGFTEPQALYLTAQQATGGHGQPPP